jgi:acetolactate synthase I/II/III large subunit
VLGDARDTIAALLDHLPARRGNAAQDLPALREAVWTGLARDPRTADAVAFLRSVEAAVAEDTVIVCDMAVPGYWYGGYGLVSGPRRLQYPVGWGTLGYALPASVGPAAAGHRVLTICGDGGLLFAVGELATLAQHRLPVTVLVVDDGAYGMLRYDQEAAGDPIRGVVLNSPGWQALGDAFGIEVGEVDGVGAELAEALSAALGSGRPRLVVTHAALTPPRTTSPRWFA